MKAADGPQLRENDMMIRRYLAGATLSVALTIANPVKADLLGGNANGALNGTLSGRIGEIGGMADGRATGSIGAQTGAIDRVGQRTGDEAAAVNVDLVAAADRHADLRDFAIDLDQAVGDALFERTARAQACLCEDLVQAFLHARRFGCVAALQ